MFVQKRQCVDSCPKDYPLVMNYDQCVSSCPNMTFVSKGQGGSGECKKCHDQCALGCFGPQSNHCLRVAGVPMCRHLQMEGQCVQECIGDTKAQGSTCLHADSQSVNYNYITYSFRLLLFKFRSNQYQVRSHQQPSAVEFTVALF